MKVYFVGGSVNKLTTVDNVMKRVKEGTVLMVGGFIGAGGPEVLLDRLAESGIKNLTIIANDTGFPGRGIGKLMER